MERVALPYWKLPSLRIKSISKSGSGMGIGSPEPSSGSVKCVQLAMALRSRTKNNDIDDDTYFLMMAQLVMNHRDGVVIGFTHEVVETAHFS